MGVWRIFPRVRSQEQSCCEVCRRAPDAVRDVLLTRLTCDDSSPAALARLARSVTFVGTNEELTKVRDGLWSLHGLNQFTKLRMQWAD